MKRQIFILWVGLWCANPLAAQRPAVVAALEDTAERLKRETSGVIQVDRRQIPGPGNPSSFTKWNGAWAEDMLRSLEDLGFPVGSLEIVCPDDAYQMHRCRLAGASAVMAASLPVRNGDETRVRTRFFYNDPFARPGFSGVPYGERDVYLQQRGGQWHVVRSVRILVGH